MKQLIIITLIFTVGLFIARSQVVTNISKINSELTERPWLDHSVHKLNDYEITKIFGERDAHQRHSNMGSITTMAYLDNKLLLASLDSMNISSDEKESLSGSYTSAKGGAIQLFISRASQSRANFKWFFIVIRGEDDKEKIMEIDLDYQAAELPLANGWWNYTTILLPDELQLPFYVYVNDRQSQHLSDFKFLIRK